MKKRIIVLISLVGLLAVGCQKKQISKAIPASSSSKIEKSQSETKKSSSETPIEKSVPVDYQKTTLADAKAAIDQVGWINSESGLPQIDLGYQIKASTQGAAGSTYLTWLEGKWSLNIRTTNQVVGEAEKGVDLAKQLVAYFEKNALPAPSDVGKVMINLNPDQTSSISIQWNEGNIFHQIKSSSIWDAIKYGVQLN